MAKNSVNGDLTTLDTIPLSSGVTGQITTSDNYVFGTGTLFLTEFSEGDWIFDDAGSQLGRIKRIVDDVIAYMEDPLDTDIAVAQAFKKVSQSRAREISLTNIGGSPTTVDGSTFPAGQAKSWNETMMYGGSQRDFVDPLIVDGATSACTYLISY